ncbi:MAG TPA: hypothetical protein ENN17_05925 [bacterium]|nr:hypothetical protein [bacterium]
MKYMNPVVILGLFQTSINAARILHKRGIQVIGYDYDKTQPGFHSRLIEACHCPDPLFQTEQLFLFLQDRLSRLKHKPVLIPSSDEYVFFLNRYRQEFSERAHFLLPPEKSVGILLDRKLQFEAAAKAGLKVPEYIEVSSREEMEASADQIEYPVFIKSRKSYQWRKYFNDKGFQANCPDELKKAVQMLMNRKIDFLIQKIIPGNTTNNIEINLLRLNGGNKLFHTVRKIRQYPVDFGTATSVHTEEIQELEEKVFRFVDQTRLTGFSNTEFKFDRRKQDFFFVETNPRIWLQVDLCEYLDDNLLMIAYQSLTGFPFQAKPRKRRKVYWIDVPGDLVSLIRQKNTRAGDYFLWIQNVIQAKSHGTFYWRDPLPFFRFMGSVLCRKLFRSGKKQYPSL